VGMRLEDAVCVLHRRGARVVRHLRTVPPRGKPPGSGCWRVVRVRWLNAAEAELTLAWHPDPSRKVSVG